jgi:hypothetical protein
MQFVFLDLPIGPALWSSSLPATRLT